jgi:hypothetical protein
MEELKRHETITEDAARILLAAVKVIKLDTARFNMQAWMVVPAILGGVPRELANVKEYEQHHSVCGVTLCLAGFIVELMPKTVRARYAECRYSISYSAAHYLFGAEDVFRC